MIDLHCHVLPGIDDGPRSVQDSIALARAAEAAGVRTIVATPHVTWDLDNRAESIARGVEELGATLRAEGIGVALRTGGEIAIAHSIDLDEDELRALRLGGGPWLLMECPLTVAAAGFERVLHDLQARGHRIVLAHPERSPALQRDPAKLQALVDAGMLSSVTAGSLRGAFGRTVQRFTFELFEAGLVHNVASDAHDARGRPPGMREEILAADAELPGIAEQAEWLTASVPGAVIAGEEVPPPPVPAPRRRRRGLLRRVARSR